jgi:precorrin-6B methylase 2
MKRFKEWLIRVVPPPVYNFLKRIRQLDLLFFSMIGESSYFARNFFSARSDALARKFLISHDCTLNHDEENLKILVIAKGPFQSFRYATTPDLWFDSLTSLLQKQEGIYEQEVLEVLGSRSWKLVIDIGAGSGYYSLGMLHKELVDSAILFESDERFFPLIDRTARENDIATNKFRVFGKVSPEQLKRVLLSSSAETDHILVICDIEGYESLLFTEEICRLLNKVGANVLLEFHRGQIYKFSSSFEFMDNIRKYFGMQVLNTMSRKLDHVFAFQIDPVDRWLLASEGRAEGSQYLLTPSRLTCD